MAGTDVTIIIKAIDSSSKTIKDVAASLKNLASATVAFNKDAVKSAQESQKLETLRSKTLTENEKRLTMFNKSQAQIATENQKRLTEEQRTLTANNKMQLDAYGGIIKVVGAAAKADEQVAGIRAKNAAQNIKNSKAEEDAVKRVEQAHIRASKSVEQSQRTTQKAFLQTTPFIQKQIDAIKGMGEQIVVAGAILGGFIAILKQAWDLSFQGAQLKRLADSGEALAKGFGLNLTAAVLKIKAASLDTITTQQALLEVNRSLLLGITADSDKLAKLMEIAAFRGRTMGLNTTDAFDRITLGIGRLSTRILDDIGIVIDGETAYADYGKSIGKTADQLTEAEKRLALTNAIIEQGNALLKISGGLVEDNATAYERLATHVTDATNALKIHLSEGISPLVRSIDLLVFGEQMFVDILDVHAMEVLKTSQSHKEYATELQRSAEAAGFAIDAEGNLTKTYWNGFAVRTEIIRSNFEMEESEYRAAKAVDNSSRNFRGHSKTLEDVAGGVDKYRKALEALDGILGKTADVSFDSALQAADKYNESLDLGEGLLNNWRMQMGLVDMAVLKFNADLKAAGEIQSPGGIRITPEEFLQAFLPIGTTQYNKKLRELTNEFNDDMEQVQADAADRIAEVNTTFARKELDDQIDLTRDLEDLQSETSDKKEDAAKKHARKMVNIEEDYQKDVRKILRKFELSRLRALIDLDAKALFEAEQQRDEDLKNAEDARDEKKKDEDTDYKDRLDEAEKFEEDKRDEILKAYERRRQDALRDQAQRIADIKTDEAEKAALAQTNFNDEKAKLKTELDKQTGAYQTAYNERAKDMLNFFQTNKNILDSLKKGALDPTDILSQFNQVGGIPFGGLPFTPTEPNQPPPTGTHDCPEGKIWDPDAGHCVWDDRFGLTGGGGGGNTLTGGTPMRGTLTLNVTGNIDSAFGQLLRSAISSTVIDIISD